MRTSLSAKLKIFTDLAAEDLEALDKLSADARRYKAGYSLITEGSRPENVFLLVKGWACRYKLLDDGSRQIMAYLIPGDLCDIHVFILKEMDHGIGLLSDAEVASVPKKVMLDLIQTRPLISEALLWATLVDEAVLREWLVNMGQRDAYERIAHLFCEMWARMRQVGLVDGSRFAMPLTQEELGDTMGLTPVHVNRTLQRMRSEGLITLAERTLTIHDVDKLMVISGFNPNYLHADRRK